MEQINLYKLVLDNWYWNRFNSIRDYQRTIINLNSMSTANFTRDLRTLEMNLGRGQGATTAIAEFIKEHPDLKILCVFNSKSFMAHFKNTYDIRESKKLILSYSDLNCIRGDAVNSYDIVFLDSASILNTTNIQPFINQLNSSFNKNQWVVKFG